MTNKEKDARLGYIRIRPRIDSRLVREARSAGIDIDATAERALITAIAEARATCAGSPQPVE